MKLGNIELPNRICLLAHRTNFGRKSRLNERHLAYYRRRAQGGCGLIVLGELSILANDYPWEGMIEIYHPDAIADFQRLTDAVHELDTPIFAQLNHHGFQSNGARSRCETWGPSAVSDVVFGEICKSMEPEDIAEVIQAFSQAAKRVKQGGFDGLEIDMGPESLLHQFLSPLSNLRRDDYGGSLENRLRFALEMVDTVRGAVGADSTLAVRLNADEMHPKGGLTHEDAKRVAIRLEATAQIDFIDISLGTFHNLFLVEGSMHTPLAYTVSLSAGIRSVVTIPVYASNRINDPHLAEKILRDGQGDMVDMVLKAS